MDDWPSRRQFFAALALLATAPRAHAANRVLDAAPLTIPAVVSVSLSPTAAPLIAPSLLAPAPRAELASPLSPAAVPAARLERGVRAIPAAVARSLASLRALAPARIAPPESAIPASLAFDGAILSARESVADGPALQASLDELLVEAREALSGRRPDAVKAIDALELIRWSRAYRPAAEHDAWIASRASELTDLTQRAIALLSEELRGLAAHRGREAAHERLEAVVGARPEWAELNRSWLEPLREQFPAEETRTEPKPPQGGPDELMDLARRYLGARKFRQAEYILDVFKAKHLDWANAHAAELADAREALKRGMFEAFERKKALPAPGELRRLREYSRAQAHGVNRGFGFKQPVKQDPETFYCTIYSLYYAFEAAAGFVDPNMNLGTFTDLVRETLKDPLLGLKMPEGQKGHGLSTHRVRTLMKEWGYRLDIVEMMHRLARPFTEKELLELFRPDLVVIPVFIMAQSYPREGTIREEHKGFLRDAFFSPSENRWIFVVMDALIGRNAFYSFDELTTFLHRLFVIHVKRPFPFAAPQDPPAPSNN